MTDVFNDIESLDDDDLERVNRLIKKLASRKSSDQNEGDTLSRSQRKRRKKVDNRDDEAIMDHGEGRKRPRNRKVVTPEEDRRQRRQSRQGRATPRTERNKRRQGGVRRKNKGSAGRTESFDTSGGRENRFLKMRERNEAQKDVAIDRALSGGQQPTLRPQQYEPVEAQCRKCDLYFDVHPSQVYDDPDLGLVFTCNNCAGR